MTPGHYTELFFLDGATALAAGHRPCAQCRRDRFNAFRSRLATRRASTMRAILAGYGPEVHGSAGPAR
jgi:hypothetical protein